MGDAGYIDVHHHHICPGLLEQLRIHQPGQHALLDWSVGQSLADMDRAGVTRAYLSVPPPGVWFGAGNDAARDAARLARESNEYGAALARQHPGRFGLFASLPLPDIDASLAEIQYSLDVLKADGIALLTNHGGTWLGEPAFEPVMAELDRRKAVVYTHPAVAPCCAGLIGAVPDHLIELATDTSRAICSLMLSGSLRAHRNIRFIFSHAGGTLPYLTERLTWYFGARPELAAVMPAGPIDELRRLYYDTANSANKYAMPCLLELVSVSQVLFGTDFPFRTSEEHIRGLASLGYSDRDIQSIARDNVLRMFSREEPT